MPGAKERDLASSLSVDGSVHVSTAPPLTRPMILHSDRDRTAGHVVRDTNNLVGVIAKEQDRGRNLPGVGGPKLKEYDREPGEHTAQNTEASYDSPPISDV